MAEDITVEGDSGGHTDNQTLVALVPRILALRDEISARHGYTRDIRVGAAGGLGTPSAVAAAFALGAAYVVTGSVNQSAVDVGLMTAMGALGFGLRKLGFEVAPIVFGLILSPNIEMTLRQSLALSGGSYAIFLERPLAAALLASALALLALGLVPALRRKLGA